MGRFVLGQGENNSQRGRGGLLDAEKGERGKGIIVIEMGGGESTFSSCSSLRGESEKLSRIFIGTVIRVSGRKQTETLLNRNRGVSEMVLLFCIEGLGLFRGR